MKHFFTFATSALLTAILISGCKKKDNEKPLLSCYANSLKDVNGKPLGQYEYDASNRLSKLTSYVYTPNVKDHPATVYHFTFEYDSQNQLTKYNQFKGTDPNPEYYYELTNDSKGNPTIIKTYKVDSFGSATLTVTTTAEYNADGQLTKIADATGGYIRYEYSSVGNVTKFLTKQAGKAEQLLEEFTSYDGNPSAIFPNRVLQLLYATGIYSAFGINYSHNNVLTSTIYNNGASGALTFTYEYNENHYPTKMTISANGKQDSYSYAYDCK